MKLQQTDAAVVAKANHRTAAVVPGQAGIASTEVRS